MFLQSMSGQRAVLLSALLVAACSGEKSNTNTQESPVASGTPTSSASNTTTTGVPSATGTPNGSVTSPGTTAAMPTTTSTPTTTNTEVPGTGVPSSSTAVPGTGVPATGTPSTGASNTAVPTGSASATASSGEDTSGAGGTSGDDTSAGGMDNAGGTDDTSAGGADDTDPPAEVNPLEHLAASAEEVGVLLANRFSKQMLAYSSVANLPGDGYKTACEWYGSLAVANLTGNADLLATLVTKFDPLKTNFVADMKSKEAHVDRYIYGMVPLEIYLQTGDESYLPLGTEVADTQQTTNQTRNAIDDMFMMTGLQLEAYRATGDAKYIDFMSQTMVDYLGAQQDNGLFFHNVNEAPVHWGRGNGWFAAGMAEMMRDLPPEAANYETIVDGYKKMMEGLLQFQGDNGLWYQVLNMPDNGSNWEESSGSAMFTYAMIAGVRSGVLDAATYVPAIDKAWAGLQTKIAANGDVSDICVGTWYKASAQEYMGLTRLTGDGHGQAPVLWAAAELLR